MHLGIPLAGACAPASPRLETGGVICAQAGSEDGVPLSQKELDRLALLPEYTLDNAHYYCETADVSRPFPSARPVGQPSWEFVWNRWLTEALRQCGLPAACPHLMQVRFRAGLETHSCSLTQA